MKIDYALLLLKPSGFTGGPCRSRGTSIRSNAVPLQCSLVSIGRLIDEWAGTDTEGSSRGLDEMQYRYLRGRTEENHVITQDSRWYIKDLD